MNKNIQLLKGQYTLVFRDIHFITFQLLFIKTKVFSFVLKSYNVVF